MRKSLYPVAAPLVAIALLVAGMPLVIGLVPEPNQSAFTLNICRPAQVLNAASTHCSVPVLTATRLSHPNWDFDVSEPDRAFSPTRMSEGPNPPPPKTSSQLF